MKKSLCALLVLLTAAPALAEDYPAYDGSIEREATLRLQEKLPALRNGYGIMPDLRLTVRDETKIAPMQRLIDMDKGKYRGRIYWL